MKQTRAVEFGTGLFVLLGVAALFFLTTQTTNIRAYRSAEGYTLFARFDNVGGLKVRAPVTVSARLGDHARPVSAQHVPRLAEFLRQR